MSTITKRCRRGISLPASLALGIGISALSLPSVSRAANIWDGGGADGNWSTALNWDDDAVPTFPAALTFDGTSQLASTNDLSALTVNGFTFNSGAGAFVIGGQAITLGGDIVNNSASLQTINLDLATTAVRTINTASGDITLGGVISGTGGGITKTGAGTLILSAANTYTGTTRVNAGTLKLGASNTLPTTGNVVLGTANGTTNTLDLAGFSQTIGTLASGGTANSAGTITSSAAGGSLTITGGGTGGNAFGGTLFTGTLALTISGTNLTSSTSNNYQIVNANNTFSGGLTIKSSGASSLTTANLATAGGLATGASSAGTEGLRFSSSAAIGAGNITLDNGQLFGITGVGTVTNAISVTSRGGVIHGEVSGQVFSGALSNAGGLLVINSNTGNAKTLNFSGDMSGFSGTIAIDTTNIGAIGLQGSATGNANTNLLWFGNGTNGGTGRVQWNGTGDATLTFGELNNLNSGAVGSTMSGIIEDNVAATTATFSIGNANPTAATFQGVIRNGAGTVALTKTGTNTQTLSGANTYTGATTINGGKLNITGSLAAGSAVSINNGGTLGVNGSGVVSGTVAVNGGGTLGGTGTVNGAVTVASGSTGSTQGAINLVDNAIGTLTLTDVGGLALGGAAGNASRLDFEVSSSTADLLSLAGNAFTVNDGGAIITITSLGITSGVTYDLMNFGSGLGTGFVIGSGTTVGALSLSNPSISFGVTGSLNVTATAVQLVTSGAAAPPTAYWSGIQGNTWAANDGIDGNFTTDLAGTNFVHAYPAATTDVIFAGNGATNLSNTLGQAYDIKSLTFLSTVGVTSIGGGSQLQIEAGGITVQSGAGAVSLGMSALALGATQTWTNNSSNALTVTAAVSGSGGLTIVGPVNLGGSSFSSGSLTVNGALDVKGTSITTGDFSGSGSITNTGSSNASLSATVTSDSTYSGTLSDGGAGKTLSLVKAGSAMLTLTGANSYTGTTSVNAGTLQLGNATALGTSSATVGSGATLDLNGQTITNSVSAAGTGVGGAGAIINSNLGAAAAINSDILNSVNFTVGGDGDLALQRVQGSGVFTLTKQGAGTLTLGGAGMTAPNNLLALDVEAGAVNLDVPAATALAIDRGLRINGGTVKYTGASTNVIGDPNPVIVNNGTFDMNGHSDTAGTLTIGDGTNNGIIAGAGSTYTVNATSGQFASNAASSTSTIEAKSGTVNVDLSEVAAAGIVLNKTTSGEVILSGVNSYTGATNVNDGTLRVNGSLLATGVVNFNSTGATLAGSGSVGNVTLTSGNFLSPGDGATAIGTLTAASLTWTGGDLVFDLSAGDNTSDLLAVTGLFSSIGGTTFTFDFSGGQAGQTYTLATFGSTDFTDGSQFTAAGVNGTFTLNGNDLQFTAAAVPEPGTLALVCGALGFLTICRRRLRKVSSH